MNELAKRQKQIIGFANSAERKRLAAYFSRTSIASAFGYARQENAHSNFIAWLLTPSPEKNDHGLGDLALRKLLETLALVCGGLPHAKGRLPQPISNALTVGAFNLSGVSVEREKYLDGGRLDIYAEGVITIAGADYPLRVGIENKVKSDEHDAQTERYIAALNRLQSGDGVYLNVFLTPLNNREYEALAEPQCAAKDFIQLNYQYLADYVISPCRESAPNDALKRYLDDYLFALGLPEIRQDKGDVIMAINKEERELLAGFWNAHKDLLLAATLSLLDSDILDDDERDVLSTAIAPSAKDLSKYSWRFGESHGDNLPKNQTVRAVVTHYAQNQKSCTLKALQDAFPNALQGEVFGVLATIEDVTDKGWSRWFYDNPAQIIQLADCRVCVCTQWKQRFFTDFITRAKELGYSITQKRP